MSDRNLFITKLAKANQFKAISEPQPDDLTSVYNTLLELKENIEVLTRQRGTKFQSAVTVEDLLSLGIELNAADAMTDAEIKTAYENNSDTNAYTDAEQTKLSGIENGADVTDTSNVTAAGALMDSEVDADIKTLSLPANTTISSFGATLIDDSDAETARNTLSVAIEKIASTTVSSPVASVTFDANSYSAAFDGTYTKLIFTLESIVPATDNVDFDMRLGTGATPTYQSADYRGHWNRGDDVANTYTGLSTTGTAGDLFIAKSVGSASGEGYSGEVILYNPENSNIYKTVTMHGVYTEESGIAKIFVGGGHWAGGLDAITGISFDFSSGNIESGIFTMYGLLA